HVGVFVKDHAVEIEAAQSVRVVCTVEPDATAAWEIDAELSLIGRCAEAQRVVLHVLPGNVLGLAVERRHVGKARLPVLALKSALDELLDARHRFAGTTMSNSNCPSLVSLEQAAEVRAALDLDLCDVSQMPERP